MKKYLLCVVFLLFIGLTSVFMLIGPKSNYSENEKRYLTEMPAFSTESLKDGSFFGEFSSFLSDRIPLRDFYVGVNAYTNLLMGKNGANKVYFADDGYLINAPEEGGEENFIKNTDKFESFSKQLNIPSKLIIIPRAGYILEDKLPLLSKEYNDGEYLKLADSKTDFVQLVDVTETLKNKDEQVFYKTDHHLTSMGNFLIYDYLSDNEYVKYNKESYDSFYGTTRSSSGYWLTKSDNVELWQDGGEYTVTIIESGKEDKKSDSLFFKEHLKNDDKYPVFLDGNHPLVKIENNSGGEGNLLIIKDSFAQGLAPFLARDYKNIYLIDMRYYRAPVTTFIQENNVDEILYVYGLSTLLTDTSAMWLM